MEGVMTGPHVRSETRATAETVDVGIPAHSILALGPARPSSYSDLARRAALVVRSHFTPLARRLEWPLFALGYTTCAVAIGMAAGIEVGVHRANARHVETLRQVVPALEAAVAAHAHETAAISDTLAALGGGER